MVAGIRIKNDFGTNQIDQDYQNYGYITKVPVTISITSPSVPEQGLYSIAVPGTNALVGVQCSTLFHTGLGSFFDGATWSFYWKFFTEFAFTGTISETVNFYIFNTPEGETFGNIGIRITNPNTGQLAYHSDMRPLTMVDFLPGNSSYTGVSGRSYVPVITRIPTIVEFFFGVGYRARTYSMRSVGSTIQTRSEPLPANYTDLGAYADVGDYAVMDVTGL